MGNETTNENYRTRSLYRLMDGGNFLFVACQEIYRDYQFVLDESINVKLIDVVNLYWSLTPFEKGYILNFWDTGSKSSLIGQWIMEELKYDVITPEGARRMAFEGNRVILLDPWKEKK